MPDTFKHLLSIKCWVVIIFISDTDLVFYFCIKCYYSIVLCIATCIVFISWPWNIRTHRNGITIPKWKRNNAFSSALCRIPNRLCCEMISACGVCGRVTGDSGMGTWGPKWQHVRAFSLANAPHVFNDQVELSSALSISISLSVAGLDLLLLLLLFVGANKVLVIVWFMCAPGTANIKAYKYADKLRLLIIRPIDSIDNTISLEIYTNMVGSTGHTGQPGFIT